MLTLHEFLDIMSQEISIFMKYIFSTLNMLENLFCLCFFLFSFFGFFLSSDYYKWNNTMERFFPPLVLFWNLVPKEKKYLKEWQFFMLHGIELQMKYFSDAKGLFLIERKLIFFVCLHVCSRKGNHWAKQNWARKDNQRRCTKGNRPTCYKAMQHCYWAIQINANVWHTLPQQVPAWTVEANKMMKDRFIISSWTLTHLVLSYNYQAVLRSIGSVTIKAKPTSKKTMFFVHYQGLEENRSSGIGRKASEENPLS